ncbi:MAG: pitrilysin family protein [Pseudomonadota bacterium]|nr:pitrilysin family protein [Pseudomonadota bacterium]
MKPPPHSLRRWLAGLAIALVPQLALAALPIEHWRTSNDVPVYFVRADAIPMVDVSVLFDAGSRRDPSGRRGVASMVGRMLDKGAGELDETGLAEGFAGIGAELGGGAGTDRASVSVRTLSEPATLDRAIELTALVIGSPRFDAAVLDREKARLGQALAQSLTEPSTIARRRFNELLYPGHPYGRNLDPADVAAIEVDDLRAFHRAHYVARGAAVAMIGAIDRGKAERIAERLVGSLPPGGPPEPMPPVGEGSPGVEARIDHPASQSHILLGMPVLTRADPDYFALYVGNHVLGGGGFVSRLYEEVREQRGLAYSVYSHFMPMRQPGPFLIGLQTGKARTDEALEVVRETIRRFVAEGPSAEELAAAKSNLIGGFALRIDSNARILGQLALIAHEGLPLDWLDIWIERIEAVTLEQVRDAFRRRIDPDRLSVVVVGAGADPGATVDPNPAPAPRGRPE